MALRVYSSLIDVNQPEDTAIFTNPLITQDLNHLGNTAIALTPAQLDFDCVNVNDDTFNFSLAHYSYLQLDGDLWPVIILSVPATEVAAEKTIECTDIFGVATTWTESVLFVWDRPYTEAVFDMDLGIYVGTNTFDLRSRRIVK